MAAVFESVLRMSAVGSIVIFTVLIVRFFLKNAPKKYSYFLWAIVLLRLLCPFTIESPLSTIPKALPFDESIEMLSQPYEQPYVETPSFTEPIIQPYPGESENNGRGDVYQSNGNTSVESFTQTPAAKPDWLHILSVIWLCGVAAMAVWGLWGYLRLKRRLRDAMACDNGVYLSYKVDSPFVLGFLLPKIYLPGDISAEEWEYIVMHERCHIRRGDHVTRVFAFAALALHWFNPLVWLAFILSGKDMELSCDEAVIRTLGPQIRGDYSASLLSLATGRPILSAMPLAFGEGDPKGRIRNLAKWRKPTRAMMIAAVIVCIVAAVCLLTDPMERDAQIRVNGRVYTYVGSEEIPIGQIWELGTLEGILHRSDEEPEEDFHGTNLDEKYAGQPLYAGLDGRIYLFDENGFFLPFELPKGDIVSGPIEVARGDFNRDGQKDFITVTEYSDCVEIVLADSLSAKILWKDTASFAEGQQKCFIARKGEDGDSIIRYTFTEDGYCQYHRFFIGGDGELDAEKGRSPIDSLLEVSFTDPEAISASLPKNSTFLLSTYGGSTVIGPIIRDGSEISPEEIYCKTAFRKLAETEACHYTWEIYIDGELRTDLPRNEAWYHGEDWLFVRSADMPDAAQSQTIMEAYGEQYVLSYLGEERTMLGRFTNGEFNAYAAKPPETFLSYDMEFVSETETEEGTVYSFRVLTDGVETDSITSFVFLKSGRLIEARFQSETAEAVIDGVAQLTSQTVVISFPEISAAECREAIDAAYEEIMAEARVTGFDKIEAVGSGEPSPKEQLCREALEKVLAAESAQITKMYGLGNITNRVTLLYEGDDWYWSDAGQGYSTGIVCVDGDYCAFEQTSGGEVWERCEHTPIIMPNPFALNDYPREFTGREEAEAGYYMLHFTADPVAAGLPNASDAAGNVKESFMFSADGELVSISRRVQLSVGDGAGEQEYIETIAVEYYAPAVLREPIMAHYTACINSIAEREKAVTENAVYDNGSEVIAVPYGESLVIDLDGDGIEEVLNMKVGISGVYSLSVNGEELFSQVKSYVSQFNTAEENRYPDYYVLRTYESDCSPKICVYDGGPSSDPITHIFTYFRSLQYVGSIPCHPSKMTLEGNHLVSGPARLRVFQTWYAEHTWYLPNNGTKLSEVERDFYYVEDFEFISYSIGDTYYPQSKYGPLLCDVYAYEKMDISADAEVLKEGTELGILGTDNAEWILVADRSGEEYYLHLSGINAYSIDTPQGEAMGNAVFHGLHYFD